MKRKTFKEQMEMIKNFPITGEYTRKAQSGENYRIGIPYDPNSYRLEAAKDLKWAQ